YARLDEVDRWVLDRLARLVDRVRRAYEEYQFHIVVHSVHNFCAVDLSAQYLDVIKDRLYTSAPDDPRRRAAQTACYDIFQPPTLFTVSQVPPETDPQPGRVSYESQDIPGLVIGVDRASGEKCERCWTRSEEVGRDPAHPTLCGRCVRVVTRAR